MATDPIAGAMKCTVGWVTTVNPEQMQLGFHTGLREEDANLEAIFDAMELFIGELATSSALQGITTQKMVLSVWSAGPGFTGWHQFRVRDTSTNRGGGDRLPPQLSCVLGYRNTSETGIAIGRRRNRMFLPPMPTSVLGADGRLTTSFIANVATATDALQGRLQAAVDAVPLTAVDGLGVVSPAEGVIMAAEEYAVGRAVDTHRSRREKIPENTTYISL